MITLTEAAVAKVKEFAESEGMPPTIRLVIRGGGCGGLTPDIVLEEIISDSDEIMEQDGIKIVVDMFSIHYLDDKCILDFVQDDYVMGFKFLFKDENTVSCGCGASIGFKA